MNSSRFFRVRCIVGRVVEVQKSGTPCFFVMISIRLTVTVLQYVQAYKKVY